MSIDKQLKVFNALLAINIDTAALLHIDNLKITTEMDQATLFSVDNLH